MVYEDSVQAVRLYERAVVSVVGFIIVEVEWRTAGSPAPKKQLLANSGLLLHLIEHGGKLLIQSLRCVTLPEGTNSLVIRYLVKCAVDAILAPEFGAGNLHICL